MVHGGDIYRNRVELDFSVNINPFGMPESVRRELRNAVEACGQYPDIESEELRRVIADSLSVPDTWVRCGNGASELFAAIVHGLSCHKRKKGERQPLRTLIPVPSFFGYEKAAQMSGGETVFYEMKEADGFALTEEVLGAIGREIDLMFLANPNNPVGNVIEPELLEKIAVKCRECGVTLVLDECFITFTGEEERYSFIKKIEEFPNVIVVQAFTKLYAIPGVRLGYLVCADLKLLSEISGQLPEWNLSIFAQRAGVAALGETQYVEESMAFVGAERKVMTKSIAECGITVFPSKSNYLFLHTDRNLYEELLSQGILIRDCSNFRGLKRGYYRVAVKSHKENETLLAVLCKEKKANKAKMVIDRQEERKGPQVEYVLPADIEKRSFEIIGNELAEQHIVLSPAEEPVTKRVIHTSADFSYASTMTYSREAVTVAKRLLKEGADIVTDTNMALAGINKKVLQRFGGEAHCFMAEEETVRIAKERGMTRAAVSMERASRIEKPVIFAIGNAPTALIALHEMYQKGIYTPAFVIGVPVGFVNVEAAKELILSTDIPCIINRGRKGGSNVAAAICNALLYELARDNQ